LYGPHFWALAIHRCEDYRKAQLPMLPVTHGFAFTRLCIVLYSVLLLAVSFLPYVIGMCAEFYLMAASTLGLMFIYYSLRLYGKDGHSRSLKLFQFSILYLLLLFVAMIVDHNFFLERVL
jgi:protoheme IX farnesyltransferase